MPSSQNAPNINALPSPSIGQYLLDRLHDYGILHIFGVPGDYVLRFNKLIENHSDIKFINTVRENTAGYAADGYARMRGLGVACITYGVGINISNALSQAYVESSPLVAISGAAGVEEFKQQKARHHLINTTTGPHGDRTQLEVFKNLTIDQGILDNPKTAAHIIDRVLHNCLKHKKPVYFELPRDCVDLPLPTPFTPSKHSPHISDPDALKEALSETKWILSKSSRPMIWAGHEILRFGLSQDLLSFAETFHIPIVSSLLGKTVIDEHHSLFIGVYQGEMCLKDVADAFHQCDCLLMAGLLLNDLDTGIFTAKLDQNQRISANQKGLTIGKHHYDIYFSDYIRALKDLSLTKKFHFPVKSRYSHLPKEIKSNENAKTTTKHVFQCLQQFIKPEHIIVSDVGDCLFASADLVLYYNSFMASAYFASLGFGIPGAIGAQLAEPNRRAIAIIGDGGFQMTAMELATAVRYHLDPVVILLNNHGYGTERILLEGSYNDILNWNYTLIPKVLGGGVGIKVETEQAFESALKQALSQRGEFYLIEVELEKLDFSPALNRLGELLGQEINR